MRRQREDESGLGSLHDCLAREARSPSSCRSTRAAGCSLRGSTQILHFKVKRWVQREDESGLGSLHDCLAREARGPGSCTSTRAVGYGLRDSGQISQLKVERSVFLNSLRVVLLDYGENVQGEPAREREEQLVERRQAGQQHWRHDCVAEQQQRIVVGVVLVVIRRGVITAGEHGEPSAVLKLNFAPHRTPGVTSRSPAVLVTLATPRLSGATGKTSTRGPGGRRAGTSTRGASHGRGGGTGRAGRAPGLD